MKRLYSVTVLLVFSIALGACSSGAGKTEASDSANPTQDITNMGGTTTESAKNTTGANLIAANDCFTCHKINEKNIGPSYQQIAEKYDYNQGNVENLAHKIIKGGKGLWGQNAMNPHPSLSMPDAEAMSTYILSLNTADTLR